jgi:hypothetical protein
MPMQTLLPSKDQEQTVHTHSQPSASKSNDSSARTWHISISLGAALALGSFFLPWVTFLGTELTGAALQKHFPSYRLIWVMPLLAAITFLFNLARVQLEPIRRLAGLCPFVILAVAMSRLGPEIIEELKYGAWIGLIAGLLLTFIPAKPKQ